MRRNLDDNAGYITLPDGSVGLAAPFYNTASNSGSFKIESSNTAIGIYNVSSDLEFDGNYYEWINLNSDNRANFVVPAYPVNDLGNDVILEGVGGASDRTINPKTEVASGDEQWNKGEFVVTTVAGSRVVMSPSATDASMVEVRINDSSNVIMHSWNDGFQVQCVEEVTGCY